jgi:LacI family transcriptional regulator
LRRTRKLKLREKVARNSADKPLAPSPTSERRGGQLPNPTIKDVARLARVSTATVSNVINGTSFVSAPLKARVHEAVAQLGFAPSRVAQGLRMQSTRLIGIVVTDITNPFFSELVRRVGSIADSLGYNVLLCEADHDPIKELSALRLLASHRVEGVLLAPTGPPSMYFEPPISNFPRPIVMIDRVIPESRFDGVSIDNRQAALDVTRHILSLGHVRVAAVAGWRHLSNTTERVDGFREALAEFGLDPSEGPVICADFRQDRARELARDLLVASRRPTALFVSNNEMVIGTMQAISELGLACPFNISLAGIDDFPWASAFAPRLTTARQPIEALAEHGVRILHARIRGESGPPERVVLKARLIVRDSCAPPESTTETPALKPARPRVKRLAGARTEDGVADAIE